MPIFTLIGLILGVIKVAMEIAAWLQAHPEVTQSARAALQRAAVALEQAHGELAEHVAPPEAP